MSKGNSTFFKEPYKAIFYDHMVILFISQITIVSNNNCSNFTLIKEAHSLTGWLNNIVAISFVLEKTNDSCSGHYATKTGKRFISREIANRIISTLQKRKKNSINMGVQTMLNVNFKVIHNVQWFVQQKNNVDNIIASKEITHKNSGKKFIFLAVLNFCVQNVPQREYVKLKDESIAFV